jgi:hypothetical protein
MARLDQTALRLDLLRARGSLERAELQAAVLDLKGATRPLASLLGMASGAAQGLTRARRSRAGSVAAMLVSALRGRAWLLSTLVTLATRRRTRRWLLLGGAVALAGWFAYNAASGTKKESDAAH